MRRKVAGFYHGRTTLSNADRPATSSDKLHPLEEYVKPAAGEPLDPNLAVELQYGKTYGAPHLVDWLTEHIKRTHNPPNDNWEVLNTAGNTDGFDGLLRTLFMRGDSMLVEEFAYPGSLVAAQTQGVSCVGVPMDGDGILVPEMDKILTEWDEKARGARKPKAVLMVPTCSNPTGYTMPAARKRELYAVARKHNILIFEDDPYCFLQIRKYDDSGRLLPIEETFLSMDVDGRVLRLDSFSKIVAPGSRCGWLTGPKEIVSAVMQRSEASTQCPSGFTVSAIAAVVRAWGGHEGFEQKYLPHISKVYEERARAMVSFFEKYLPAEAAEWPAASGGMFIWLRLKVENHPKRDALSPEDVAERAFQKAVKKKVLTVPSKFFKGEGLPDWTKEQEQRRIFLRICYATPTIEELETGVQRLAEALKEEWEL